MKHVEAARNAFFVAPLAAKHHILLVVPFPEIFRPWPKVWYGRSEPMSPGQSIFRKKCENFEKKYFSRNHQKWCKMQRKTVQSIRNVPNALFSEAFSIFSRSGGCDSDRVRLRGPHPGPDFPNPGRNPHPRRRLPHRTHPPFRPEPSRTRLPPFPDPSSGPKSPSRPPRPHLVSQILRVS